MKILKCHFGPLFAIIVTSVVIAHSNVAKISNNSRPHLTHFIFIYIASAHNNSLLYIVLLPFYEITMCCVLSSGAEERESEIKVKKEKILSHLLDYSHGAIDEK